MKTEIIKVKLEKDDVKSLEKVKVFINDLINKSVEYKKGWYKINDSCYNIVELDVFMDFLKNLTDTDVIELT